MSHQAHDFKVVFYSGDRKVGKIAVVEQQQGEVLVNMIATGPDTGLEKSHKPVMLGMTPEQQVVLMNPVNKEVKITAEFPADAFPAHIYSDPVSDCAWFMNDGDKATGNDTLNCGDQGSSVTVVDSPNSAAARHLATICVGRGHHQAAFTFPSPEKPDTPRMAAISNLQDGTLSLIGNDPAKADTYLKVLFTVNLAEPDKEKGMAEASVPNNAFPHGLVFSPLTGLLYNLNNGYGTVAVIDPVSGEILRRFDYKGHSNLFITPDGKYIFGRGADRKSDPDHVIAKLSVLDVAQEKILNSMDLPDIYISKYFFNPEGSKLYLNTGSSGSDEQKANLITDELLAFDLGSLPVLNAPARIKLASSGTLAFAEESGQTVLVFSSDSQGGALDVIDPHSDQTLARLDVHEGNGHSRIWMMS